MDYRSLNSHKNKGHSPFFLPPIMRSSVGQCRNIRFRQLYASHVITTSDTVEAYSNCGLTSVLYATDFRSLFTGDTFEDNHSPGFPCYTCHLYGESIDVYLISSVRV